MRYRLDETIVNKETKRLKNRIWIERIIGNRGDYQATENYIQINPIELLAHGKFIQTN
jgi:hypothetical protein